MFITTTPPTLWVFCWKSHNHQPLGAAEGQASDIIIHAKHIEQTREKLNKILAENTGKPIETIRIDTERDNFMSAYEAMEYGLIDKVLEKR